MENLYYNFNAVDESIKSYEYNEYQPITGTQLNSAGQITITIENQLLIEGDVLKADDTRYADADLIALTNHGCGLIQGWTPDINATAVAANTAFQYVNAF